jgi:hypothetical protein
VGIHETAAQPLLLPIVNGQRLYQLIRQNGAIVDHTFEIRFLDPGIEAHAFTLAERINPVLMKAGIVQAPASP